VIGDLVDDVLVHVLTQPMTQPNQVTHGERLLTDVTIMWKRGRHHFVMSHAGAGGSLAMRIGIGPNEIIGMHQSPDSLVMTSTLCIPHSQSCQPAPTDVAAATTADALLPALGAERPGLLRGRNVNWEFTFRLALKAHQARQSHELLR